jgi:uncharacterized protein (TIGR02444 family)
MRQLGRGVSAGEAGEGFWRFSLALYARPGIAEALIALQERAGYDVNLVLFALWAGAVLGVRLDAAALAAAESAIGGLRRDVVEPLRALRRRLKAEPEADVRDLRRKILGLELAAERRVQQRLAQGVAAVAGTNRLAVAEANLALYLAAEAQSSEADLLRAALAALARRD